MFIISEIMTKTVHTVTAQTSLAELKSIFDSVGYRHLLVEQDSKLLGVISDRDVARHMSPFIGSDKQRAQDLDQMQMPASELMSPNPVTVDDESLIDSASILLIENNISCLPVVNELGYILGIVSWKDILQYHVYGVERSLE